MTNIFRAQDFSGQDLSGQDLSGANLIGADLSGANLYRADLSGANLIGADLSSAYLTRANLYRANLSGANLSGADLTRADLTRANLFNVIGNMREIKSAQFDEWQIVWTRDQNNQDILQIGCQSHPLTKWKNADPIWIRAMHSNAAVWWDKYGEFIISLVELSPATPWNNKSLT